MECRAHEAKLMEHAPMRENLLERPSPMRERTFKDSPEQKSLNENYAHGAGKMFSAPMKEENYKIPRPSLYNQF